MAHQARLPVTIVNLGAAIAVSNELQGSPDPGPHVRPLHFTLPYLGLYSHLDLLSWLHFAGVSLILLLGSRHWDSWFSGSPFVFH